MFSWKFWKKVNLVILEEIRGSWFRNSKIIRFHENLGKILFWSFWMQYLEVGSELAKLYVFKKILEKSYFGHFGCNTWKLVQKQQNQVFSWKFWKNLILVILEAIPESRCRNGKNMCIPENLGKKSRWSFWKQYLQVGSETARICVCMKSLEKPKFGHFESNTAK